MARRSGSVETTAHPASVTSEIGSEPSRNRLPCRQNTMNYPAASRGVSFPVLARHSVLDTESSRAFWIPASAGMTNSRQAAGNEPSWIKAHNTVSNPLVSASPCPSPVQGEGGEMKSTSRNSPVPRWPTNYPAASRGVSSPVLARHSVLDTESSLVFWIPASAGMTNSRQAAGNEPSWIQGGPG